MIRFNIQLNDGKFHIDETFRSAPPDTCPHCGAAMYTARCSVCGTRVYNLTPDTRASRVYVHMKHPLDGSEIYFPLDLEHAQFNLEEHSAPVLYSDNSPQIQMGFMKLLINAPVIGDIVVDKRKEGIDDGRH